MIRRSLLSGCLTSAMIVFTVPLVAATVSDCSAEKPDAWGYLWDFHGEANTIFRAVQTDAQQALEHADMLQSFEGADSPTWQAHAGQLNRLKAIVNDMGQKLCRLEKIRRVVAPWQQKTIDRMAITIRLLADNTEDAILFGDANQHDLWNLTYQKYVNNLYDEAKALKQSVGNAVEYGRLLKQYQGLRRDLNLKGS